MLLCLLKNHGEHRRHREKRLLSVLWYERVGYRYSFMFIYEPQFIADSVVNYPCLFSVIPVAR